MITRAMIRRVERLESSMGQKREKLQIMIQFIAPDGRVTSTLLLGATPDKESRSAKRERREADPGIELFSDTVVALTGSVFGRLDLLAALAPQNADESTHRVFLPPGGADDLVERHSLGSPH